MNNFCFFVGPGKTGSTWLYNNLRHHPDIKLPKNIKETNYYFDNNNPDFYYNKFFNYGENKKINLDISNTYIYRDKIAEVIKINHPDAKIIIGYRDSFERLKSMYLFKIRNGQIPSKFSIKEALKDDKFNLIKHSKYFKLSEPYISRFEKKNIFIFNFHLIKNNPKQLLEEINEFLNISNYLSEKDLYRVVNPASKFRLPFFSRYSSFISDLLRKLNLYLVLDFIKTNRFIQSIVFKRVDTNREMDFDKKEIENLDFTIEEDNKKFKSYFNID
jgi:hypothetical protein